MRATGFWPLIAFTLVALPSSVLADARDYPGTAGNPRMRNSASGDLGRGDFDHRPHRPIRPVVVVPGTVVVSPDYYGQDSYGYGSPPPAAYAPPTVIYAPPAAAPPPPPPYPPASSYAPEPPPAPTAPRVVEFDSGRYEMRGDGIREPYVWVWVPKPPSAPPGMPPKRPATVYRWTDEQGVVTLTDDLNKIPAQYRPTSDR